MKYCTKCGRQVDDTTDYCPNCGYRFTDSSATDDFSNDNFDLSERTGSTNVSFSSTSNQLDPSTANESTILGILSIVFGASGFFLIISMIFLNKFGAEIFNQPIDNGFLGFMAFIGGIGIFAGLILGIVGLVVYKNKNNRIKSIIGISFFGFMILFSIIITAILG